MKHTVAKPQYMKIAHDIAGRIARGELREGSRLYGRSVMASQYNVSPETIRRAMMLLSDMKVIRVLPQSGTVVLSADNARRYIESSEDSSERREMRLRLKELLEQNAEIQRSIYETASELIESKESFAAAAEPLPFYEVTVPAGSPVIGKNIRDLRFWQATGGTVVALRRGQTLILSPGPFAELYEDDIVVIVGTPEGAAAARRMLAGDGGDCRMEAHNADTDA